MADEEKEPTYEERSKARSEGVESRAAEPDQTFAERSAERSDGIEMSRDANPLANMDYAAQSVTRSVGLEFRQDKIGFGDQQGRVGGGPPGLTEAADAETAKVVRGIAPSWAAKKTYGGDEPRKRLKIEARPTGGGGNIHPLQLVRSGNKLYVRKGTVGGEMPTIGGTPLADDYRENELTWSGDSTFWLRVTVDDGSTTAVEITTDDPGDDTANQAKLQLGSVTMDGSDIEAFSSNLTGSQQLVSCGETHVFGRL